MTETTGDFERGWANYGSDPEGAIANPGHVDEAKWEEAKKAVREQYGYSEKSDRFWRIVQTVYRKMGGE